MNAAELAERLGGKKNGTGYVAPCPAHNDKNKPNLSIKDGNKGEPIFKCFAGCSQEAVLDALRARGLWHEAKNGGGRHPRPLRATVQPSDESTQNGLNLAEYAKSKRLPVALLHKWGLSDASTYTPPAVRISYKNEQGDEIGVRFRIAADGDDKFRWKSGSKAMLYGQQRLPEARAAGYIVLVEGESDTHTCWYFDIPAAGIPGAATWKEEWAGLLAGIPTIYVVIEPDKGGETVKGWLAKSAIRDRVRLVALTDAKDPSALYLSDPEAFPDKWQAAMQAAVPWQDIEAAEAAAKTEAAWKKCSELAQQPDILTLFSQAVAAAGVAGEKRVTSLIYLITTSRLLDKPISAAVKGTSSAGKSYTTGKVLEFFPPEAFYALSGMSEHALAYSTEPLKHRMLVIYEAAGLTGEFASYLVRSLLSEGRVRYETVEKTDEGLGSRLIEREGPTGLIVTTTAVDLHPENETRLLSIPVNDTPDQTRNILLALASEADRPEVDLESWRALQEWLAGGECRVTIPYAMALAEAIPPVATRLRRDFSAVLGLIRAHALLHCATRARDKQGRIIATLTDYAAIHTLITDLIADGAGATVSPTLRNTVTVAAAALRGGKTELKVVDMATLLKLDKSTASRRVREAVERGYLTNLEEKKGRPLRLVLGDALPDDVVILPTAQELAEKFDSCAVAAETVVMDTPLSPVLELSVLEGAI